MAGNFPVKKEPQMQEENDERLDKTVEEMVPHTTHSCAFMWGEKKETTSVSCIKAATAKDLIIRSSQLKLFEMKNKGKELVFVREGRAISSHWPCSLIKDETLTVKYVKAGKGKPNDGGSVHSPGQRSSDETVIFQVLTRGGDGVKKILRNPELKKIVEEMTVYAYKGETVKQALRRDGRFLKVLFSKNFGLFCQSSELKIEMSMNVDDLDGQTYKIILLDKSKVPDSQPGSLDDTYISPNESQTHESDENQEASHQSTTSDSQTNTQKQEPTINSKTAAEEIMCEIPKSAKVKSQLLKQFKESMKGKKTVPKLSRVQNLLRVEYRQNEQTCTEVRVMKKLMDLSSSVCLVSINGSPVGSGFLLFDNFVLTNGHVIKDLYNDNSQLDVKVTVNFSYESPDEIDRGQERIVDVTEVVGFEYFADESGHDWALLRLSVGQEQLPDSLLKHCGFRPGSGGICIIGHPYGGIKKIDPCSIISSGNSIEFVEKKFLENQEHIQFVTRRFFEGVVQSVQQHSQKLNYKTCFYFGSSGSPVFDKYCRVVAMHSGGYTYDNASGVEQSVVEFGYHMSDILEHIIVQLVVKQRFDVLKSYLTYDFPDKQGILNNVKKLVESRNLPVRSLENINDDDLKMFFAFLCQREEPVPMDMSEV